MADLDVVTHALRIFWQRDFANRFLVCCVLQALLQMVVLVNVVSLKILSHTV